MDCFTRIASLCCTVFLSLFLIGCVLFFFGSIVFSAQGAYVGFAGYVTQPDYVKITVFMVLFMAVALLFAGVMDYNRRPHT